MEKIERTINYMTKKDDEWGLFLTTLSGKDLDKETKIYEQFVSGPDGYYALILEAQERLAKLATYLHEINEQMMEIKHTGGQTMRQTSGAVTPNTNLGNVSGSLYGSRPASPGFELLGTGSGVSEILHSQVGTHIGQTIPVAQVGPTNTSPIPQKLVGQDIAPQALFQAQVSKQDSTEARPQAHVGQDT